MCTKNKVSIIYFKNFLPTVFSRIELVNQKRGKNSTEETIQENKVSQLFLEKNISSCFNKQILDRSFFFVHTLFQFTKQHVHTNAII